MALQRDDRGRVVERVLTEAELVEVAVRSAAGERLCDIAHAIGVGPRTLSRIIERDDRVREARDRGRSELYREAVGVLVNTMRDESHPKRLNAAIMLLNNAYGWKHGRGAEDSLGDGRVRISIDLPDSLPKEVYQQWVTQKVDNAKVIESEPEPSDD